MEPSEMSLSSYPPLFRREKQYHQDPPTSFLRPENAFPPSLQLPEPDVPVVDLRRLDMDVLLKACREWGIFRLVNHSLPPQLSAQLRSLAADLFSLPYDSKKASFGADSLLTYFWGTPVVDRKVESVNRVEGLHTVLSKVGADPLLRRHQNHGGDNSGTVESLRCGLEEYGHHMARIGRTIFDVLAKDLELDAAMAELYLVENKGAIRIYRYPSYVGEDEEAIFGMAAHTDSSVISILNQDDVGGLQLLHNNQWVDVKPIPNTLIVNLGDMIKAMSNDRYQSVEHRVTVNPRKDRLSICYFAFPNEDEVIVSSKYKPFTYKQFQEQVRDDIKNTGFKVGLKQFRKGDFDIISLPTAEIILKSSE